MLDKITMRVLEAAKDAGEGVVEAANVAMGEIVQSRCGEDAERNVWEPVANALSECVPEDMDDRCDGAGEDFVGVTSDTRRIVMWGPEIQVPGQRRSYREFVIGERYDA